MTKLKTEYEAKVLDINKAEIEKKLLDMGAGFNGRFEQKRFTYDVVGEKSTNRWVRLRNNGERTTLCYNLLRLIASTEQRKSNLKCQTLNKLTPS